MSSPSPLDSLLEKYTRDCDTHEEAKTKRNGKTEHKFTEKAEHFNCLKGLRNNY